MEKEYKNFESLNTIASNYTRFSLDTQRFSGNTFGKFTGGVPLMYNVENNSLYVDSTDTHTLVFGATGSLKSRAVVMPMIKILGVAGESMIINDPKGELYAKSAGELKERGYNIVAINLRDPAIGNAWNPLHIPYNEFYLKGNYDKATEFANDIAHNLALSNISQKEPFWDYASASLLFGLILLLFKYCKEHNEPQEAVNIGNVITLRHKLFDNTSSPERTELWKYAATEELIADSMSGTVFAPSGTRNSILSVFDQKLRMFSLSPTLINMLSNNNIDIANIGNSKTAVYIITPDEKTSFHQLVSLFIKQSYEYIIYSAQQNPGGKVNNRINYILDEFSSLPTINDMPTMISAARSRQIRFLLVIQSKNQLVKRYTEEADTIISNCTNWIFLTSRELELLKEISLLCGDQINGTPNISIYDLQHFSKEKYEALILCGRLRAASVRLRDIDQLESRKYPFLEYEQFNRNERKRPSFELSEEIIQKYDLKASVVDDDFDFDFDTDITPRKSIKKQDVDIDKAEEDPDTSTLPPMDEAQKEKFEAECMDAIEQVIMTNEEINKEQALEKSKFLLSFKKAAKNADPLEIAVYTRVVEEFEKASEEEIQILRKQLFDQKPE